MASIMEHRLPILRGNTYIFVKYNQNDQVKVDEMSRACSTHGEKRNAYRILVGKPEGKNHWEEPDIVRSVILKWILER
jgi:hypothetical protein